MARCFLCSNGGWKSTSIGKFSSFLVPSANEDIKNSLSVDQRTAIARQLLTPQLASKKNQQHVSRPDVNKKVYRHLMNGDYLLVNRQPTLHKPSIMAHRAKVLPGEKTIRMHYANCNTYNADFDGDEMNLHFPQNELARAEAMNIALTDFQYLSPTNGAPLRGLIQDHVVAGVAITLRDSFFERDNVMQLLFGALRWEDQEPGGGRIRLLPPAIIKPRELWTGKQIISIILLNLTWGKPPCNLRSKAQIPEQTWGGYPEEAVIKIVDGELIQGVLDKSQFGAKSYGLVHSIYELYGPATARELLSVLGRLFTKFQQTSQAFTCRMDDLRLTDEGDGWRRDLISEAGDGGREVTVEYVGLGDAQLSALQLDKELRKRMEEVTRDDSKLQGLDAKMKVRMNKLTSSIIGRCLPNGLLKPFPKNNMQMMTTSGAKGSNVNVSQISCCLGQQELEGRRVPLMVSGKSLPSFLPFETSARAGGFIAGRFLTGIKPQEYFFHCMAGREGLIDTAVKTSRSGYLQRCLIKHLEGLCVQYDNTVRDADGSVVQFLYGEDGLDVTKQRHLEQFSFIAQNQDIYSSQLNPVSAAGVLNDKDAQLWNKKGSVNGGDPTLSKFSPSRYLYSTSEMFQQKLENYAQNNPDHLLVDSSKKGSKKRLNKNSFKTLLSLKYLHSLVDPGEAVGLLAAQGIGEPSTQMTLNTFHFAGFGAVWLFSL